MAWSGYNGHPHQFNCCFVTDIITELHKLWAYLRRNQSPMTDIYIHWNLPCYFSSFALLSLCKRWKWHGKFLTQTKQLSMSQSNRVSGVDAAKVSCHPQVAVSHKIRGQLDRLQPMWHPLRSGMISTWARPKTTTAPQRDRQLLVKDKRRGQQSWKWTPMRSVYTGQGEKWGPLPRRIYMTLDSVSDPPSTIP